jgi:hypothetical protein
MFSVCVLHSNQNQVIGNGSSKLNLQRFLLVAVFCGLFFRWHHPGTGPKSSNQKNTVRSLRVRSIQRLGQIWRYVSGWWFQPLWKIWKSFGIMIPNIWKIKNVPNFQTTNQCIVSPSQGEWFIKLSPKFVDVEVLPEDHLDVEVASYPSMKPS